MNDKPERMPNVPPFVRFVASAVPMVFDNSLSYYEALCALWKYIQDMTDVVNNNATLEEEFIDKVNELETYVNTYFDNLDVQEEINNKLDAMAEAGTLSDIISQYLNSTAIFGFDTVADMKLATNLTDGSYARTLGFHSINDGGGALYHITDTGTANEMDVIAIDTLYANLVEPKNVRQFGAYGDGTHDDTSYFERALAVSPTMFIPAGNYLLGNVDTPADTILSGEKDSVLLGISGSDYILRLDSNTNIKGISFDGNDSTGNAVITANLKSNITIDKCNFTDVSHKAVIFTDTTDVKVESCTFSNVQDVGVLVIPSTKNVDNVAVKDCKFSNVAQSSLAYAVYFNSGDTYYVKDSVIEDCIVNSAGYGGYFPGGDNNSVINCSAYNCAGWRGIWVHDSANIIIRGGTYASCGKDGIYVSKAHNVIIDGVTAYNNTNNGIGIDGDQTASGRYQTTATNKNTTVCNCLVFNNNQYNGDYCGIRIGGTGETNCTIANNNIYDDQATVTHKRSIETVANGSGHIVMGNICGLSKQKGIECPSAVVLTDNTLNGVGNGTLYDLSRSAIVGQGDVTVSNQSVNNGANVLFTYNPPTGYEVVSARYIPNISTASGGVTLTAPMQWGSGVRVRIVNNTGSAQVVEGKITFYYKKTVS